VVALSARASAGRIPLLAILLSLAIPLVGTAIAGPIHDPFLERFRVGFYRDLDDLELAGAWPGDLLTPSSLDSAWVARARHLCSGPSLHRADDLLNWRFVVPALGTATAADAWHRERAELLAALAAGQPPPPGWLEAPPGDPWLKDVVAHAALTAHAAGHPGRAIAFFEEGLAKKAVLGLTTEEIFIWNLRVLKLRGDTGRSVAPDPRPWPSLADLGPYDVRSGWTLWVAHRQARRLPVLPAAAADEDLGRLLLRVGVAEIEAAELRTVGFPDEVAAGLGGVLLPVDELGTHFDHYPTPPRDPEFQSAWVRGQRRWRRAETGHYEALARRVDLTPDLRADLWRRASEIHLIQGRWDPGIADLELALVTMRHQVAVGTARRIREWCEQALVLAVAHGRRDEAGRILVLARDELPEPAEARFLTTIDPWLESLGGRGSEPAMVDAVDAARYRVRNAGSPPVATGAEAARLPARRDLTARLWEIWARWGVGLAEIEGATDPGTRGYVATLRRLAWREPGRERLAAACAAVGHRLGGAGLAEQLAGWLLTEDIYRTAGGAARPMRSPVPRFERSLRRGGNNRRLLDRHALLGFALAAGDARGMVAVAINLRLAGDISRQERRLFLFPLPAPGPVADALAATPVETALLLAVARNESLFEPAARSRAGALGWVQIMPFHFRQRGLAGDGAAHWSQPARSLAVGGALLAENLARYDGDPYRSLAAYNAGPGAVKRWTRQLGGVTDPTIFMVWIGYPETRSYVEKVLVDREIYRTLLGESGVADPAGGGNDRAPGGGSVPAATGSAR